MPAVPAVVGAAGFLLGPRRCNQSGQASIRSMRVEGELPGNGGLRSERPEAMTRPRGDGPLKILRSRSISLTMDQRREPRFVADQPVTITLLRYPEIRLSATVTNASGR